MKLRKTPKSERTTYTYYFDNGDKIILEPGKQTTIRASGYVSVKVDDSITELAIAQMHKDDDKEVESNLNYINCETRAEAEKRRQLSMPAAGVCDTSYWQILRCETAETREMGFPRFFCKYLRVRSFQRYGGREWHRGYWQYRSDT